MVECTAAAIGGGTTVDAVDVVTCFGALVADDVVAVVDDVVAGSGAECAA